MSQKKYLVSFLAVSTALVLIGAGCSNEPAAQSPSPVGSQPSEQQPAPATSADQGQTAQTAGAGAVVAPVTDNVKEFTMTAKNWAFVPSTITVKKGDKVRIKITSVDIEHGFALPDFNINVDLQPGQTQVVEFVADKTGTFNFRCSIPCGEGHREMRGVLIVQ